jgi:muramoyltetrapeptide carboxypeptidase
VILPGPLKHGDKVAFVATARKTSKEELQPAADKLREWGLEAVYAPGLFEEYNQFAGEDKNRASSLQWALDNPDIRAVWFARGGYGTVRIIDQLDFSKFRKDPKWLIGYSDITVLHSHLLKNHHIGALHATMPLNVQKNTPDTLESLRMALFGDKLSYELPDHELNRFGNISGTLVGGNLSVLYSILGSASDMDFSGKVLFLEDLDEYLYHIDRMMMGLKRAGKLRNLGGLLIGAMSEMRDNAIPYGFTAEQIVRQAVEEYEYPVYFNVPAGHVSDNRALVMGAEVSVANGLMAFA